MWRFNYNFLIIIKRLKLIFSPDRMVTLFGLRQIL